MMLPLNHENWKNGFLFDGDRMAGVAYNQKLFSAFIIDTTLATTIFYSTYPSLDAALQALALSSYQWTFEPLDGCGKTCKLGGGCSIQGKGKRCCSKD